MTLEEERLQSRFQKVRHCLQLETCLSTLLYMTAISSIRTSKPPFLNADTLKGSHEFDVIC